MVRVITFSPRVTEVLMPNGSRLATVTLMVVAAILLLAGCGGSGGTSASTGSSGASATLQNLPNPRAELPASLSEETGSATTSSLSTMQTLSERIITADDIPSTKAQGWYDMRRYTGLGEISRAFYDALKAYAAENDFETGTIIQPGERPFIDMDMDGTIDPLDLGQFILDGTDEDFTVYWKVNPTIDGMSFTGYIVMDVTKTGDDYAILSEIQTSDGNRLYSRFNTATGNSLIYETCPEDAPGGPTCMEEYTTLAAAQSDGDEVSVVAFNRFSFEENGNALTYETQSVAWGDDTQGGVRNYDSCTGAGCQDQPQFSFKEYYDGSGNLVRQDWGDTSPPIWMEKSATTDLKALWDSDTDCTGGAPTSFYAVEDSSSQPATIYVSDQSSSVPGECYVTQSEYAYEWAWDGSGEADWSQGDATYGWAASGPGEGSEWWTRYDLSLEVGAGETVGDVTYYYSAQVPVKQLLPLRDGADLLEVDSGEVEEDWGTYRDVRYFIDDGPTPGQLDGNVDEFNQGSSYDTALWDVFWMQNYVWNDETGEAESTAAPWLQVRDAGDGNLAIPTIFTDRPGRAELVTAVDTQIDAVAQNLDADSIIDPAWLAIIDPAFDPTNLDDLSQRSGFDVLD